LTNRFQVLDRAIAISQIEHPAIVGALYGVDAAALDVNVIESRYIRRSISRRGSTDATTRPRCNPTIPFIASLTTQAACRSMTAA